MYRSIKRYTEMDRFILDFYPKRVARAYKRAMKRLNNKRLRR